MFRGVLPLASRDIVGLGFGTSLDQLGLPLIRLATRPSTRLGIGRVSFSRIREGSDFAFGDHRSAVLMP